MFTSKQKFSVFVEFCFFIVTEPTQKRKRKETDGDELYETTIPLSTSKGSETTKGGDTMRTLGDIVDEGENVNDDVEQMFNPNLKVPTKGVTNGSDVTPTKN